MSPVVRFRVTDVRDIPGRGALLVSGDLLEGRDASEERRGRRPTAEQSAELERRLREIHGLDLETGFYRD